MCGIAGWIDWTRDLQKERHVLAAMTRAIQHRGPDGFGEWICSAALLGHCRLAVVDAIGGTQPMQAERNGLAATLVWAGEIYNHRQIASDLQTCGVALRTRSDTEIILQAYLEWGTKFVDRLDGMFSIALWDHGRKSLVLVRDHFGIKPLYYFYYQDGLVFGSEPKALLANPLLRAEVTPEGLSELLGLWPYKTPGHAIYYGMKEVRPAELLEFKPGSSRSTRYWTLPAWLHVDVLGPSMRTVRELLDEAVAANLVADVPVGALLSGGVDSTAVVALAAREMSIQDHRELSTFSVDYSYSQPAFQPSVFRPSRDTPYINLAATRLGTRHTSIVLTSEDLANTDTAVLVARDLPDSADMDGSLYLLTARMSNSHKVALCGEGADEVFGGYPWYREALDRPLETFPWTRHLCFEQSLLKPDIVKDLGLGDYVQERFSQAISCVPKVPGEEALETRMRALAYLELCWFLPGQLDRMDRMGMANGVEIRVPYCNRRLVEYAWNMPWSIRMAGGIEKGVLRRSVLDVVPPEVALRPKSAYPTNADPVFRERLATRLRQCSEDRRSPLYDLINHSLLVRLLDGRAEPPASRATVWMGRLVSLYQWFNRYNVTLRT